jgi:methionyl aminopeptidase
MTNIDLISHLILIKDEKWLEKQRIAGKTVAQCLKKSKELIETENNISLKDIEKQCIDIISENGCTPTFKNYKGFSGAICTSVNKQIVHGIPSKYKVKNGDIVKIDIGATYEGAIGDAAITAIGGGFDKAMPQHYEMVRACQKMLEIGINAAKPGNHVGQIGFKMYEYIKETDFNVITAYGGHGLEYNKLHAAPFVDNKSEKDHGIVLQPNMTICIEPMITIGSNKTKVGKDGWTVTTEKVNAHCEHTLFIHKDCTEILTKLQ